ncbi:hypothetical protein EDB87DRAFT_1642664 [Lactarius vividus]|nr:hypothetical protein EDB87DRAFT_1642664 [Lactarius vividus]
MFLDISSRMNHFQIRTSGIHGPGFRSSTYRLKHTRIVLSSPCLAFSKHFFLLPCFLRSCICYCRENNGHRSLSLGPKSQSPLDVIRTEIHFSWWFPSASFNRDANIYKRKLEQSCDIPYEATERALGGAFHYDVDDPSEKPTPEGQGITTQYICWGIDSVCWT